jgi:cytochrome P450
MRMFRQQDVSAFDTLDHDKHRQRREPWNPYFSKQSVSRLQPLLIQAVVNRLCMRLAECHAAGKPANMVHAFACVTTDVISEYSFPQGYNLLDKPDFDFAHYDAWMALSKVSHVLKQFGWLYPLLDSLPAWVTKYTNKDMYLVLRSQELLYRQTLALAE